MQYVLDHLGQWLMAACVVFVGVYVALSALGNLFPGTRFGAWCLHAAMVTRATLAKVQEAQKAVAAVKPGVGTIIVPEEAAKVADELTKKGGGQ